MEVVSASALEREAAAITAAPKSYASAAARSAAAAGGGAAPASGTAVKPSFPAITITTGTVRVHVNLAASPARWGAHEALLAACGEGGRPAAALFRFFPFSCAPPARAPATRHTAAQHPVPRARPPRAALTHPAPRVPPCLPPSFRHPQGRDELRSIRVPPHRYTPLREAWDAIIKPVVEHLKLMVRMNTKQRTVEIKVSARTRRGDWCRRRAPSASF
jgi:hypothetical protein